MPPLSDEDDPMLDRLDALLLAGGADLDPALYGEPPHPETAGLRPDRDDSELRLLRRAVERDLPVLGICRGAQLIAVAHGGRLDQHLPQTVAHDRHRPAPGEYGTHPVSLVAGTLAGKLLDEEVTVASYHHQGIADAGSLTVSAQADDGTIEAVEAPAAKFRLGVLWHPEVGTDPRLFRALIAASRDHGLVAG